MSEWSSEPWAEFGDRHSAGVLMDSTKRSRLVAFCCAADANPVDEDRANAARIVACVNACAGIRDPAEAIEKAKEALRGAANLIDCIGTTDCDKELAKDCRAALAALENE